MTAPAPSPAEQAVIDRFGIFEPEARVVEEVARALYLDSYGPASPWTWDEIGVARAGFRRQAAAAVAAYRAAQDGATCGDLSPSINFGGDSDAERLMCELPVGHGGAHQHDNGDGLPPTRWIAAQDGGAEEAARRVEAVVGELDAARASSSEVTARLAYREAADALRAALAPQAGDER